MSELFFTEEEKAIVAKIMQEEQKPFMGTKVTYFFPDEEKLRPVSYVGHPPSKGEIVCFTNYKIVNEPDMDFNRRKKWRVKDVWHSMTVAGSSKDIFLFGNLHRVEVYLEGD